MRVRITEFFRGVADGEVYPREFRAGDEVDGDLAAAALAQGKGVEVKGAGKPSGSPPSGADTVQPSVRARLKKAIEIEDDNGGLVKLAKGAIIEGALAEQAVARGEADLLEDGVKSRGAAPNNK